MLQKILFVISTFILTATLLADNTGCGLGTSLWKGNKGRVLELSAVTTNDAPYLDGIASAIYPGAGVALTTSNTQGWAITSGTSGYQDGAAIGQSEVTSFVDQNMDNLASDMSKGKGEYIDTLAELMGIERKNAFKWKMKKNFENIYTHDGITSKEVVENIYYYSKS